MSARPLIWVFAGLFLLFGVFILLTDSRDLQQVWAGLSTLSLGGFALSLVKDALATKQIQLQETVIRHATQPRLFWSAVIIVATAGAGVSIAGVWFLIF